LMETSAVARPLLSPELTQGGPQLRRPKDSQKTAWCTPPKNWRTTPNCCDCLGVGNLRCICDGGDSRNFESRLVVRICARGPSPTPRSEHVGLMGAESRYKSCRGKNVFGQRPEEWPFLGAETALGCAGGSVAGDSPQLVFWRIGGTFRHQELRHSLAEAAVPQAAHRA
jgi:hypothetical protein